MVQALHGEDADSGGESGAESGAEGVGGQGGRLPDVKQTETEEDRKAWTKTWIPSSVIHSIRAEVMGTVNVAVCRALCAWRADSQYPFVIPGIKAYPEPDDEEEELKTKEEDEEESREEEYKFS